MASIAPAAWLDAQAWLQAQNASDSAQPATTRPASPEAQRDAVAAPTANLLVLAGYMKKVPDAVLQKLHNRVVNIHPALLPEVGRPADAIKFFQGLSFVVGGTEEEVRRKDRELDESIERGARILAAINELPPPLPDDESEES